MSAASRRWLWFPAVALLGAGLFGLFVRGQGTPAPADPGTEFATVVTPLVKKYCLACHSTKVKKGRLDLERLVSARALPKDVKPWQQVIEQLEAGEMPPRKRPQPTAAERRRLITWVSRFLDAEAKSHTGDPGRVPLRRLSNFEYDCTVRDLTGVDLQPTREFPADGAAGEGFTNAAEALSDVTPALFARYLAAAKEIARHAVLLPDGFRFSAGKTRRDWTDESTARLRAFYQAHTGPEGRLTVQPYLAALVRHREGLRAGTVTVADVAAKEQVNPRYLAVLWRALEDQARSYPLDRIRSRFRAATEPDVPALANEIAAWQAALWKTSKIGSYIRPEGAGYAENLTRQVPNDPPVTGSVPVRVALKPAPGQADVVLCLATRELTPAGGGPVVWHHPRFEARGKPALLLRDYAEFGPGFEVDCTRAFVGSSRYLAAVLEAANDRKLTPEGLAKKHGLDPSFLRRWIEALAVDRLREGGPVRRIPAVALELLPEQVPPDKSRPAIHGWRKRQSDLPVLVTNASDRVEHIPGRVSPHGVAVHPLPQEFVAVSWKSPVAGAVRITWRVTHAHPACGNGVAWWLEHRRGGLAAVLDEGVLDLGKEARPAARTLPIHPGDQLVLAVDARDGNHACDLTELAFTITENGPRGRVWDLAADVADSVQAGNPHPDRHGNPDTWSFVRGPSPGGVGKTGPLIPSASVLSRWRQAAAEAARAGEAARLATQVEALLSGPRPTKDRAPDRALYDQMVSLESPLFVGVPLTQLARPRTSGTGYGLPKQRFGTRPDGRPMDDASLVCPADTVTAVRLPAALFAGREFVVEGQLGDNPGDRVVEFGVLTTPPGPDLRWGAAGPMVAAPGSPGCRHVLQGFADFRRVFPLFLCFPPVVPTDEVVCLKMFHREDEPLERLFLDEQARRHLDRLWDEHRFISRQPVLEDAYLPQFIGFVTQDQPKAMVAHFESQRPAFKKRAEALLREEEAAIPRQLDALLEFACRAYRRPLQGDEKQDLLRLYQAVRARGAGHDEAFRGVLARIFLAPAFLFRIEKAPPGTEPRPVNDWELASRLSYFLWSSAPDEQLLQLAAAGRLGDPKVLEAQTRRMLQDGRLRALAIEFGTQWIHVRGLDQLKEKNEKLFPQFDAQLRKDIYEEAIFFFQDLFQHDRAVTQILDADYTYLNADLARHYGIPGVQGPQWRRVDGVRKYGRGGILGLAAVHAKQSGASRTSPVLRGNWVVETLLGEKLPRPPANVPVLPDVAGGTDRLTTRQMVERHVSNPSCAACHVRIDPFGFAFEKYDPIGRLRGQEAGGLLIDARARLRDGTEFEGLDGLRTYLLTKKKDVVVRLFCRRLLGYALGRATTLADTSLIDQMVAELNRNEGRISAAVLTLVRSPQFRMIRGSRSADDE